MEIAIAIGVIGLAAIAAYVYRESQETERERERTVRATVPKPAPAPEPIPGGDSISIPAPTPAPTPQPTPAPAPAPAPGPAEPEPVLAGPDTIRIYIDGHKIPRRNNTQPPVLPERVVEPGDRLAVPVRFVIPPFEAEARDAVTAALLRISNPSSYEAGCEIITGINELADGSEHFIRDQGTDVWFVERLEFRVLEGSLPGNKPIRLHAPDSSGLGLRHWLAWTNEADAVVEVEVPLKVSSDAERNYIVDFAIDFGNRGNMQWDARLPITVAQ